VSLPGLNEREVDEFLIEQIITQKRQLVNWSKGFLSIAMIGWRAHRL
jgi:hypothetical protein